VQEQGSIEVDPVKWRGRKKRLQTYFGRLDKALLKQPPRLGLARRIGQGGSNTADKVRIFLADVDFDSHETPAHHARAVCRKRGFCFGHFRSSRFPEKIPEIARERWRL
jgi:hypothetical protein